MKQAKLAEDTLTIELSDEDFLILAHAAHERDITLNQLMNNILKEGLAREEAKDGKEDSGILAKPDHTDSSS